MERRKALKNMGLALGYTVATPTLISIVQSCKSEPVATWTPVFFTPEEGNALTKLVDIIIPKTDTMSASEVQVDLFIDKFADEVMEKEQQDFWKMSMAKFLEKSKKDGQKKTVMDLEPDDLEFTLANALKASKDEQKAFQEQLDTYNEAVIGGESPSLADNVAVYGFANALRGMTIWGYKSSEYVGENVLAYLPVPGEYIPCGDVQELTDGKDWSL